MNLKSSYKNKYDPFITFAHLEERIRTIQFIHFLYFNVIEVVILVFKQINKRAKVGERGDFYPE